jgi:hypothetical protein
MYIRERVEFFSNIEKCIPKSYVNSVTLCKTEEENLLWIGINSRYPKNESYELPEIKGIDFSCFVKSSKTEVNKFVVKESAEKPSADFTTYMVWKKEGTNPMWENVEKIFKEESYHIEKCFFLWERKYASAGAMEMYFLMKIVPDLTGKRRGKWIASKTGILESFAEFVKLNANHES